MAEPYDFCKSKNEVKESETAMLLSAQKPPPEGTDVGRPRTGQTPLQHIRIPDDEWGVLREVLGRRGPSVVRQLIRWFLRIPGAKLPARPSEQEIAAARERYAEKKRKKSGDANDPD